jgi:uncharacterized protein YdeI (YjbR/CyaY-like superfamily)
MAEELPLLTVASSAAWDTWLEAHGATSAGVRLRIARKGSPLVTVSYAEAVEVALCHGWIDSQASRGDDEAYAQRFTPRRSRSPWSEVNRSKALALIAAGRMRPGGLAEVERAQADGRWDRAYAPQSTMAVPDDLRAALDAEPAVAEAFARLKSSDRYSVLWRVAEAKRAETRTRRIATYVERLRTTGGISR